ncbi:MAG: site-specific DNA-methyltransferase [Candidatus Methylomirabilis oxyfera]|nr:site-specific DNA-methyltransferase [Candidatus Methylomirabilis oxyfera]
MPRKSKKSIPVERTSANLVAEQIERLKEIFPEVVAEGRVDFEKLKATLGEIVDDRPERYSFTWAGKRDAIRLLQVPSRATLKPCLEESVDWETTKHAFIEGENLEVLKLLYKSYAGRVKMIYIDQPYNTGNDFIYPDNFADPLDTYLKLTGQKSAEGNLLTSNPETSGRYHSAWLSMMYPRLFVARQLLSDDGSIWISIDDNEFQNLKMVCNEVFGEENFVGTFIWQKRTTRENRKVFSFNHDYIICYAKQKDRFQASRNLLPLGDEILKRYSNPDKDPRGEWQSVSLNAQAGPGRRKEQFYSVTTPSGRVVDPPAGRCWVVTKERMEQLIADSRVWFGDDGKNVPRLKVFRSEARDGLTPHTLWAADEVGTTDSSKKALIKLFGGVEVYDTPKPVELIERITQIATGPEDGTVIMDFFAGSATAAHATLNANRGDSGSRRFIMVQLPEPVPIDSGAKAAGFETIAEVGKERIRRAIRALNDEVSGRIDFKNRATPEDLGFRVFKLAESNYRQWWGVDERDGVKYAAEMELFTDPLLPGSKAEDVVWEVALKEGYGLSSTVEEVKGNKSNRVWRMTDPDHSQSFLICLDDTLKEATVRALKLDKDDLFVCRDAALTDEQAANLALTCKLKTI